MNITTNTEQHLDIDNLIGVVKRQPQWFLGILGLVTMIGLAIIMLLPKIYSASAEILIEQPDLYSAQSKRVSESNLSQRVQSIVRTILTKDNIERLLRTNNILEKDASVQEIQSEISRFRGSTRIDFDTALVVNATTGREGMVSMGFSITHENTTPELAFTITESLTEMVLAANQGRVSGKDQSRLGFLQDEKDKAFSTLKKIESKLSEYKKENAAFLPELQTLTVKRFEDLQSDLELIDSKISFLKKNEDDILANIATTRTNTGIYSADGTRLVTSNERMVVLQQELDNLSNEYTEHHPDIIRLKSDISALKRSIKKQKQSLSGGGSSDPTNPAHMLLLSRLKSIKNDISREVVKLDKAAKDLIETEEQLRKMPRIKEELQLLELNQESAVTRYKELEEKLVEAGLSSNMREANLLENFLLLEPPEFPISAVKPRKKLLLAILLLLAATLAYFIALIRDFKDDRISSKDEFIRFVDEPVFVIPKAA